MPIVQATGTIVGALPGTSPEIAKTLETLMHAEVVKCAEEGITDPAVILRRKLAVKDKFQGRFEA